MNVVATKNGAATMIASKASAAPARPAASWPLLGDRFRAKDVVGRIEVQEAGAVGIESAQLVAFQPGDGGAVQQLVNGQLARAKAGVDHGQQRPPVAGAERLDAAGQTTRCDRIGVGSVVA